MSRKKELRKEKTELAKELGLPNPSRYRDYSKENIRRIAGGNKPAYDQRVVKAGNVPTRPIIKQTGKIKSRKTAWKLMSKKVASIPPEVRAYLEQAKGLVPEGMEYHFAYNKYVLRQSDKKALRDVEIKYDLGNVDIY